MVNAPAVGKRRRTISTPSSVTGLSPALRLTAQFAPWPASILPNGWSEPSMRVEAVRHAPFESAADPSPARIRQRAFFIQRLFAGYPQVGEVGILNTDNALLRTNSQRGNSIDFPESPDRDGLLPQQSTDLCETYPQLTRENKARMDLPCTSDGSTVPRAAATMNARSRPPAGQELHQTRSVCLRRPVVARRESLHCSNTALAS